jgi:tetratricopeptide (TPR) repeat protein
VTLGPLSVESGEALIENLGEFPGELRAQVLRNAGGNPLFIEQLLAHALEDGEPETLPLTLDALLASRLDHLEAGELRVLQRAGVARREFSREAVLHLLPDESTVEVELRLQALVRKGLIHAVAVRERRFRFHHILIRDAAYRTLPKAQRAELHERFAGWLEGHATRSDELIGFHLEQAYGYLAELGPVEERGRRLAADAGGYLAAAGLRAAKSGDMPASSNLLTRASTLLGAAEATRRDLLTELGLVLWRSGEVADAEEAFDAAIKTAVLERDQRAELRARTELGHLRLRRAEEGAPEKLVSLASEAIPILEQLEDDRALGRIWFALATTYGGFYCRYRKSSEAAERALVHFRRSDWPFVPCLQELAAGFYYGPTPVPEALRRCRALLEEADRGGEGQVLVYLAGLEAMADRFDSGRDLAARALRIYEDLAWTVNIWANYAPGAANIELLAGDFAQAERLLAESCRALEALGLRGPLATQATQLAEAVYGQGRYDEALRWSETAEACAASYDTGAQFLWRAVRGKALAQLGKDDEGERLAQEAVDLAMATDSVSQCAHVLLCRAEVLQLGGRATDGADSIDQAIRMLEEKGNVAAGRQARALLVEVAGS